MTRPYLFRVYRALCSIAALVCFAGVARPAWGQFETRSTTALPFGAFSITTGDFNNDGNLDIAVVDDNGFSVSLGKGDGTFRRSVSYAGVVIVIAAGDFNNDGNVDLVTANEDNSISVYLGKGDGTFQSPIRTTTTDPCRFVAVGDFNGDRKLDVAIINTPYVSVLLGNGDGTFQAPSDNNSFIGPQWLAVGDLNNDHRLDVVVVGFFGGSQSIGVLLGNNDGTLQSSLTTALTSTPATVAIGDFNHDGNVDAIIADEFGGVTILLGKGDGRFQQGVNYGTTGISGGPIVVSDLNLDGELDLGVESGHGSVQGGNSQVGIDVFWGKGDGSFEPAQFFDTGRSGLPAVGDFNADHLPDLVLANEFSAVVVLNTGIMGFSPTSPLDFGVRLVGTTTPAQLVNLTNNGAVALSISSIQASGDFRASNNCGSSVAAGASCEIRVVFRPKSVGRQSGLVTIIDSASSKPQVIQLSGDGTLIDLSPNPMRFAPQKVGTTSPPQQLGITNASSASLSISNIYVDGEDQKDFAVSGIDNCTGQQLAPGDSCYITVTFAPKKTGNRKATFSVIDNAAGSLHSGSLQTSALVGTGT